MAEIKPFRGIIYNQSKIKNLSLVIAPPYDVISEEGREKLYENSLYNIIRIIKGRIEPHDSANVNQYTRAAQFLQEWLKEGILEKEAQPCLYAMEDEYTIPGSQKKSVRQGFMALIKLEEFSSRIVLPHEKTLSKPKEDRLKLMQSCRANLCPIFALYEDPVRKIDSIIRAAKTESEGPFIDVLSQDRIVHKVFRLSSPHLIQEIVSEMKSKSVLIADGHHRYETALTYWRQMEACGHQHYSGSSEYAYAMMYFANMDDPGLAILPYHRLLKNLPQEVRQNWQSILTPLFKIESFPFNGLRSTENQAREKAFSLLADKGRKSIPAFCLYPGDKHYYLLSLRRDVDLEKEIPGEQPLIYKKLNVTILDHFIINRIIGSKVSNCSEASNHSENKRVNKEDFLGFAHDIMEAISAVDNQSYQMALFLNPTHIHQVYQIASMGQTMPQKSTFFYPKLASGLLLREIIE